MTDQGNRADLEVAWDEGYTAGHHDREHETPYEARNPYRAEPTWPAYEPPADDADPTEETRR